MLWRNHRSNGAGVKSVVANKGRIQNVVSCQLLLVSKVVDNPPKHVVGNVICCVLLPESSSVGPPSYYGQSDMKVINIVSANENRPTLH